MPSHASAKSDRQSAYRARRRFVFRLAGSLIVLALLLIVLPFNELLAAVRRIPVWAWFAALVTYLSLHLIGAFKWRLLINAAGAKLLFFQAVRCYYYGLFGNIFLPSVVGGDVIRAGLAIRLNASKSGVILGSLLERVLDMTGLLLVAGVAGLLLPAALDVKNRRILLIVAGGLVFGTCIVTWILLTLRVRRLSIRMKRRLVKIRRASRALASRPRSVVLTLGLSIAIQTSLVFLNAWLGKLVGIHVSLFVWFFVWPMAKISAVIPISQGGMGVREAAQAALFAPFGVTAVMAVAMGLVFEVVIVSGGLVGGLLAWLLARKT